MKSIRIHCCVVALLGALAAPAVPAADAATDPIMAAGIGAHGLLRHDWHPGEITFSPFVEGGFGVHALSESRINNQRDFGTRLQFGERIGVGVAFDHPRRFELIAYIEHVSNARLAYPNDGITFRGIEIRAAFP